MTPDELVNICRLVDAREFVAALEAPVRQLAASQVRRTPLPPAPPPPPPLPLRRSILVDPKPYRLDPTNESVLTILALERQINDGLELSVRLLKPKEGNRPT